MTGRRSNLRINTWTAAAIVTVTAATSGCTTSGGPTPETFSPPSASSAESGASQTRTSDRLGYRIQVQTGWKVTAGYLDWEMGIEPHSGTPFVDTLAAPAGRPFILIARQQRPSGETVDQWVAQLQSTKTITYPDQCQPATPQPDTALGGEPAKSFLLHCPIDGPDAVGVQLLAMHGRLGYLLMCYDENWGATRTQELVEQCREWSNSFAYVPG